MARVYDQPELGLTTSSIRFVQQMIPGEGLQAAAAEELSGVQRSKDSGRPALSLPLLTSNFRHFNARQARYT